MPKGLFFGEEDEPFVFLEKIRTFVLQYRS